jgi:hypothetical protein
MAFWGVGWNLLSLSAWFPALFLVRRHVYAARMVATVGRPDRMAKGTSELLGAVSIQPMATRTSRGLVRIACLRPGMAAGVPLATIRPLRPNHQRLHPARTNLNVIAAWHRLAVPAPIRYCSP